MDLVGLNSFLLRKSRLITYVKAFVLFLIAWFLASNNGEVNYFLFANYLGYLSFAFISASLMVTPLRIVFPKFPFNSSLVYARRAIGVSGFVFGLMHYLIQLNVWFNWDLSLVLSFNDATGYALSASLIALFFLFLLAATSFDFFVKKLGKNWFTLHKLVYLAYPLIIYHAWRVGSDFQSGNLFSISFMFIAFITLILEALRLWKTKFEKKVV
ncbi:ferric reductase-like transmembrane domain-containing protein [Candidatus Micrarchaeota archaeon]|nr:ferric reductase-like transmembrane domain-containing protein [Candidatus Micrarchaeota archaeon]